MELKSKFEQQEQRFARAFALMREGIAARAFPGCALAAVNRGELVASAAVGHLTYEAQSSPVTATTIFDLASLTKVAATTAVAMVLYQRGVLDLDMPVEAVVREFAGGAERRNVTMRMLLAHASGLPGYVQLFEQARTREELLLAACRLPLEAAPGERTVYSDIGFIVLGEALARLADEPLDNFCQREVFGPLGMATTCFNPPRQLRSQIPPTEDDRTFRQRVIQGEVHDENASVLGGVAGHAGLFANAPDVARLAQSLLRPEGSIFRSETLQVFAATATTRFGNRGRALGFDIPSPPSQSGRYFSQRSLGHLGFTGTSLWLDPERDLAIILLSNRTWPDRSSQEIKRFRPAIHDALVEALEPGHVQAG